MRNVGLLILALLTLESCRDAPTYQKASEIAHEQIADLSYVDVAGKSDCTSDCSGHNAGFEWARENGVTESWDCPSSGNPSFVEGCEAFAHYVSTTIEEQNWDF